MTPRDIGVVRKLVKWRRANGWQHTRARWADNKHEWSKEDSHAAVIADVAEKGHTEVTVYRADSALAYAGWPSSVGEAVDVLCVLGVLPVTFSSAYQAGRESTYDREEWRVRYHGAMPHEWSLNASLEVATESLRFCRGLYADAWIEHRRTGATEWKRVDDDA